MKNVPALRFPEFTEDWPDGKLGEMGEIIGGGTPETHINKYWGGTVNWFTPTELKTKYVDYSRRKITELGLTSSSAKLLPKGTVLLTSRATVGDVSIALTECCTNQGFQSIIVNPQYSNEFLYYWLLTNKHILLRNASGSTFLEINKTEISKLRIKASSLPEQQKIAAFLTAVDDKIQQLSKKKTLLEQYKKGLMQQIFSQQIRFKPDRLSDGDEQGKEYPDWEEKKLGEVAVFYKGKGIAKSDIDSNGILECIRYGELYTHYQETIRHVKSRTNLPHEVLVLSESNDVIIPASGETQIDIATAACILRNGIAIGGDLNIIRSDLNGVFLSYYLNHQKKQEIASLAQGVSVVHLYAAQLKSLKIEIPELQEQTKIANFLSAIDDKINHIIRQISHARQFKKGLLQQMFV